MAKVSNALEKSNKTSGMDSEVRMLIQNTQDAGRYFIPVLKNMTQLVIPERLEMGSELQCIEQCGPGIKDDHVENSSVHSEELPAKRRHIEILDLDTVGKQPV